MNDTEATSYLIFRLRDSHYAVEAAAVREIVPLPDLIALDETPDYIAGVARLRGQIVPVIDLDRRFKHVPPQQRRLEDCIVVLERAGSAAGVVGIVVNEVQDVREVLAGEIEPMPSRDAAAALALAPPPPEARFLVGYVKSGEQVLMIVHLENLLRLSQSLEHGSDTAAEAGRPEDFRPDAAAAATATAHEIHVFRERALSLARPAQSDEVVGLLPPIAVVRLGAEFFGIDLKAIREFAEPRGVTPIPCCPEHIVGQMNLRGDLITLADVSGALGLPPPLPPPARAQARDDRRKVVVVNDVELRAGVVVDEVVDVVSLRLTDIAPPEPAARAAAGQEWLLGTAPLGERALTLLDLPALLMRESLTVNEES